MKKQNSNKPENGFLKNKSIKIFKKKPLENLNNNVANNQEYYKKYDNLVNKKKSKGKKAKKVLIIVLSVLLGIAVVVSSVFAYLYFSGKSKLANEPDIKVDVPNSADADDNGKTVTYNGQKYTFDNDVTSILCIGVDKDAESQLKSDAIGTNGQADALYLVSIDNNEKKYTVLSINRDSVGFVDLYTSNGEYSGQQKMQICLSFAYGNGKETSCKNTVKAVSRLLYNIPIKSYFSINKASIPLLNDIIDGVEVPAYDNSGKITGQTIFLKGQDAYNYIQYRDVSKLDSNLVRLKRQTSYIKAFASKFISRTKEDITTPLNIFDTVSLYSTTNLDASKITYLATNAFTGKSDISIDYKSVPGKVVKGEGGYAEYNVDNDKLLEVILDIFYDKVEQKQVATTQTTSVAEK